MLFKDRIDAGKQLTNLLLKDEPLIKQKSKIIVVSLLRGGMVVGGKIAKQLGVENIPLVVTKISSPDNSELAIGALCQNKIYLNRGEVSPTKENKQINKLPLKQNKFASGQAISNAKFRNQEYRKKYRISNIKYQIILKNKIILLVDDGVATGATIFAAYKFIKTCQPKKIILAVPVAPTDFDDSRFDKSFVIHKDSRLFSVSQFYAQFPQVEDEEIMYTKYYGPTSDPTTDYFV